MLMGTVDSVNYKYRMHDPRIGRFFSLDPLTPSYPELTPYQFSSNSTIFMVELEGLEGRIAVTTKWYTDEGVRNSVTNYYTVMGLKADLIKICWKPYGNPNGRIVSIDYYGRMEGGSRGVRALKGINPDAKPSVQYLNNFFGNEVNNSFEEDRQISLPESPQKTEYERQHYKDNNLETENGYDVGSVVDDTDAGGEPTFEYLDFKDNYHIGSVKCDWHGPSGIGNNYDSVLKCRQESWIENGNSTYHFITTVEKYFKDNKVILESVETDLDTTNN